MFFQFRFRPKVKNILSVIHCLTYLSLYFDLVFAAELKHLDYHRPQWHTYDMLTIGCEIIEINRALCIFLKYCKIVRINSLSPAKTTQLKLKVAWLGQSFFNRKIRMFYLIPMLKNRLVISILYKLLIKSATCLALIFTVKLHIVACLG